MIVTRELTVSELMLAEASKYLGLEEIAGEEDNDKILQMFKYIGHDWVKSDEMAWCSCFINYLAQKLQLTSSGKLNARSWLKVGEDIQKPYPGDVVVLWRESVDSWKGHVGLFMGYNKAGNIFVLGGNQANEVNITLYNSSRLLGYRRLLRCQE